MDRVWSSSLHEHVGEKVRVAGWLHATRRMGGVAFVIVRDGWGLSQGVVEDEAALAPLEGAALGSIIEMIGRVQPRPDGSGELELVAPELRIIEAIPEPPPLPLHRKRLSASLPTRLDHGVIAARHPRQRAIFRLAAGAMAAFRGYLGERGFTEIQSPKIVASATESGANVFEIDYFGRQAYLAQSPQFYKQIMVGVFERVFEVGPVFRAEPHDTSRHLAEYVSLDVEMGFVEDHHTVMALLEGLIFGILERLAVTHAPEFALFGITPPPRATIPRLDFREAQALILEQHGDDVRGEPDLSPEDERRLGAWARETHGSDFVFITGYPMVKRPFYTHPQPGAPEYSNSFDLIFRGSELVTGGQRLHRYPEYRAALAAAGLDEAPFAHYLEAFRYGMPPHGGFAIGLERFIARLCELDNVRLAALFPRDRTRLAP